MKRSVRNWWANEKEKITRRLAGSVGINLGGPVLSGMGAGSIQYEVSKKVAAIAHGGIGMITRLVRKIGLAEAIDSGLHLLKIHRPYHESDHVLSLVYSTLCGGRTLEDLDLLRNNRIMLDAFGATSIPDPTTAGDFCRRFGLADITALMDAINSVRLWVWKRAGASLLGQTARIDADGTLVPTGGECKQGSDVSYDGQWSYGPLVVSLANTNEPLYIANRSGNRPSHEGAAQWQDKAVALCREAGFTDILLRGDTDFSITSEFDRWTGDGVRFVFGYDATEKMIGLARSQPDELYEELARRTEEELGKVGRARPENERDRIVVKRNFKTLRTVCEEVVSFAYKPIKCRRGYRIVALRKTLSVSRGGKVIGTEYRYFFYITNDDALTPQQVVEEARGRCNQENLIGQLKSGVRALHAPVNTLNANWAYMVIISLAWSLKAWLALMLPIEPRWAEQHLGQRRRLLTMEFRTFVAAFINIPAQIIRQGRRLIFRLLSWNPYQYVLFRALDAL